jgi:hypothetical protein
MFCGEKPVFPWFSTSSKVNRAAVERFFGYIKQRTRRFHDNINTWKTQSIEDYATAIAIVRNLLTAIKIQGGVLLS